MVTSHHQFPAPALPRGTSPEIHTERMTIVGLLGAPTFLPWIRRHAARLGIDQTVEHADPERIELTVAGPIELLDAMEMGCSLGPIDVWVEDIRRAEAAISQP